MSELDAEEFERLMRLTLQKIRRLAKGPQTKVRQERLKKYRTILEKLQLMWYDKSTLQWWIKK